MVILAFAGLSYLPQGGCGWRDSRACCNCQARECSQAAKEGRYQSLILSLRCLCLLCGRADIAVVVSASKEACKDKLVALLSILSVVRWLT